MSVATLPPKQDQDSDRHDRKDWPSWIVPPAEGVKAEDLDHLPDLPRRTELRNGSLVFVSPQTNWHGYGMRYFWRALEDRAPQEWRVTGESAVRLESDTQREPDVLVVSAEALTREDRETWIAPEDVLFAIELESPDSLHRDRVEKPLEYAEAGIPHYWRVERGDKWSAVVHVFELEPTTRSYVPMGIFRDRLQLKVPFEIDIPIDDLSRRLSRP